MDFPETIKMPIFHGIKSKILSIKNIIKNLFECGFDFRPKNLYFVKDRYELYEKYFIKKCPKNGIILDIGSGAHPFRKATILADKYLETTRHRNEQLVIDDRDFILLDLEYLPFKDKSIDYVYCCHLLEHVDSPEKCSQELMRIAKAGYIETPNFANDVLFRWAKGMHKWHTVKINNKLVFFEYTEKELKGVRTRFWIDTIFSPSPYRNQIQDIFYKNQDLFNTILEWSDHFEVIVYRLDK